MENHIARWLVSWRYALIALSLIAAALLSYGAKNLYFESDYRFFFRPDDPNLVAHERIQTEFTKSDNVVFIVAPKDERVFSRETLASLERLTAESWKLPYSVRVDSITNYQHSRAVGDELQVAPLAENAMALTDAELVERQSIALAEPILVNSIISPQAHVTSVNIRLELPRVEGGADTATPEVMAAARELAARIEAENANLRVMVHGLVAVNQAFNDLAQDDARTLVPIMLAVVIVLLVLFLRSVSAAAVTVLIIALSLMVAVGFMGWIGYALNQINVSAPTIILTLAISDSVHILLTYLQALGQGQPRAAAMEESLRVNLVPVFLTNFTTAIGFMGLNYSDAPPFREVGNVAAFGVMATMMLSFTVLPGVMMWLPVKIKPGMGEEAHWKIIDKICEFALKHRRPLLWGTPIVVAFFSVFALRNDLNDDTIEYFDHDVPLRQVADFTQKNLTGFDSIAYELKSGEPGGVSNPEFLHKAEAFAQWYAEQPEVMHIGSFTDVIKRLNRNMHADDPAYYKIPDERELIAQYVLLYELSLPLGLDLNNQINLDKSALRFSVSIKNLKSRELIEMEERAQTWLKANAPDIATPGSSVSIMFAHIAQRNIYSMVNGAFTSILLISLTMIIALRSFKFGLISIVPNALPATMAFGIWGIFVGEVNLAVAAVFNISAGIVIDDTIHFLTKYLRARRKDGSSPEDAIRYSFATTGSALFVNTAVLALGFLVLTLSDFTVNSSMGAMTALVIVIALLFDLLFLPALLTRFDRGGPGRGWAA